MSPIGWEVGGPEDWTVSPAPITTRVRRAVTKAIGMQSTAALARARRGLAQVALSNRYGYTQPIGRRGIGVLVVGLWLTGVGMLAHQQFARTDADRLAEAAMTVAPTQYYYEVFRDTAHIGVAMSGIDTTDHQFVSTTLFRTAAELNGGAAMEGLARARRRPESMARTVGFLSRAFVLDSLDIALSGFARRAYTQRYPIPAGVTVLPPSLGPMALVMEQGARVGAMAAFGTISPVRGSTSRVVLKVVAESLFTVADSARYDSATTRWVAAHTDTVRAWRVVQSLGDGSSATAPTRPVMLASRPHLRAGTAIPLSLFDCTAGAAVWVDAHGRVVAADDAQGRRVIRTTYEIAFGNWRHRPR